MGSEKISNEVKKQVNGSSIRSILMHADRMDMGLMILGFIGSVSGGFSARMALFVFANLVNNIGSASTLDAHTLHHNVNKVALSISLSFYLSLSLTLSGSLSPKTN